MAAAKKGSCGGTPRVGSKGDDKPPRKLRGMKIKAKRAKSGRERARSGRGKAPGKIRRGK